MSPILKYSEGIQELVRRISPSLPKHPGHQRFSWPFSLDRIAGDEHARSALWRATFIRAANPNPYRRHRR
jgi:hypothetical protein